MSFHLSLVILEYHRVHPKWFLSLWYVWCKPFAYHQLTLTPSPNRLKRDSTWPKSPRSSIGASKKISEPMVCLVQTVHLSCVKISAISKQTEMSFHFSLVTYECHRVQPKRDSTWPKSPRSTIHLSSTDINTVSKWTKMRFDMTQVT
jgi:hypothetical protein